jgi:hypothetical protein
MRKYFLFIGVILVVYSCIEISAKNPGEKDPVFHSTEENLETPFSPPDSRLRVGREEATAMRKRRGKDDASVKISVKDLQSLLSGPVNERDSFIFYFVNYSPSASDERRYRIKAPNANWNNVMKKPSSFLVGFVPGDGAATGFINSKPPLTVDVYDLSVVCPPPPDCNCVISDFQR